MSSGDRYHEPIDVLSDNTREMHRALVTLIEELEAIDWYQQRADACGDEALVEILQHNKVEEIEHAMMALEWIRRRDPDFDAMIRKYLQSEGSITELESAATGERDRPSRPSPATGLGIGGSGKRGDR